MLYPNSSFSVVLIYTNNTHNLQHIWNVLLQYLSHASIETEKYVRKTKQAKKKTDSNKLLNKHPAAKSASVSEFSFSLNLEYIKFHIFLLVWVCLCVSESPAVVWKIIFTPLVSLALTQRKLDIRNAKGWMET